MDISWGQDEHDGYVDKVHWLVHKGRDDLIDEIADDYERRRVLRAARTGELRGAALPDAGEPAADLPAAEVSVEVSGERRLRLVS